MAKRKKETARRTKPRRSSSRTTASAARPLKTIQYFCNGFCTAQAKKKHAKLGDIVVLVADGTSVTLDFRNPDGSSAATSPFESEDNPIIIEADSSRFEVVIDAASNV